MGGIASFLEGVVLSSSPLSIYVVRDPRDFTIAFLIYSAIAWVQLRILKLLFPRPFVAHPLASVFLSGVLFVSLVAGLNLLKPAPPIGYRNTICMIAVLVGPLSCWFLFKLFTRFPSFVKIAARIFIFTAAAIFLFSLIVAFVPSYKLHHTPSKNFQGWNLLLITLDTTRADHLSCYGYPVKTTPFLDSLLEKGVLFRQAYTSATWTIPAHGSLFTGQLPSVIGIGFQNKILPANATTLAEILKQKGYTTAGFIGAHTLVSKFQFHQGFEYYDENLIPHNDLKRFVLCEYIKRVFHIKFGNGIGMRTAEKINASLFPYLKWVKGHQPFFVFVNYYDVHDPYNPPKKYRELLYPGKIKWAVGNLRTLKTDEQTGSLFPSEERDCAIKISSSCDIYMMQKSVPWMNRFHSYGRNSKT